MAIEKAGQLTFADRLFDLVSLKFKGRDSGNAMTVFQNISFLLQSPSTMLPENVTETPKLRLSRRAQI
jgi:hypothetical protein